MGTIHGGRDFPGVNHFAVFELATGSGAWSILAGDKAGQTQMAEVDDSSYACWSHPMAVQFAASSLEDWPALVVQVWSQTEHRANAIGEFIDLPAQPRTAIRTHNHTHTHRACHSRLWHSPPAHEARGAQSGHPNLAA